MKVSQRGIDLIREFEGFPNGGRPYVDPVGVWTIGYGTTKISGRPVGPSTSRLTQESALHLLRQQLDREYEPPVRAVAERLSLNQNEYDALVSFVYNLGPGSVQGVPGFETLSRALKNGNRRQIADALKIYDRGGGQRLPGLTRRRTAERALFLAPIPNPAPDPRYLLLTASEREHVNELLWRRRAAARNGGWSSVAPLHNVRATAAKAWLAARLLVIAVGGTSNRPKRRAYLRKVVRDPSVRQP